MERYVTTKYATNMNRDITTYDEINIFNSFPL